MDCGDDGERHQDGVRGCLLDACQALIKRCPEWERDDVATNKMGARMQFLHKSMDIFMNNY